MRKLILLAFVTSIFILNGQDAHACSCGVPSRAEIESKSEANFAKWLKATKGAVFIGRVVKKADDGDSWEFNFEVERYWSGSGARRLIIYTAGHTAACGVPYEVGKQYLVFAGIYKGELSTNLCSHLMATRYKDLYLEKFGRGKEPKS